MSDQLNTLQETALQARAKAEELKTALTDQSTDDERQAAEEAEKAAVDAENAFADAKAKAEADAASQSNSGAEQKIGDPCVNADGVAGTLQRDADGSFVCIVEPATETPNADESRTGFVETGRPGDTCVCPDGRTGTVHRFDEGLICIPNADQG